MEVDEDYALTPTPSQAQRNLERRPQSQVDHKVRGAPREPLLVRHLGLGALHFTKNVFTILRRKTEAPPKAIKCVLSVSAKLFTAFRFLNIFFLVLLSHGRSSMLKPCPLAH